MDQVSNRDFTNETVQIDGNTYDLCVFENCRMVFAGGAPPTFNGCAFSGCSWEGDEALIRAFRVIAALTETPRKED